MVRTGPTFGCPAAEDSCGTLIQQNPHRSTMGSVVETFVTCPGILPPTSWRYIIAGLAPNPRTSRFDGFVSEHKHRSASIFAGVVTHRESREVRHQPRPENLQHDPDCPVA